MNEQGKKRRKLNVSGIKAGFAFVVACLTAVGSAITGLGAQLMYAPSLSWMFGFRTEKANIIALRCAAYASLATVIVLGRNGTLHLSHLISAVVLIIASTAGAVLGAGLTVKQENLNQRRIFQILGVGLTLWTFVQASQISYLNSTVNLAHWNSYGQLFGVGILAGLITQMSRLLSGVVLIPALYFLSGFSAHQSMGIALMVVFLASLLPNLSYARQELPEPTYLNPSVIASLVGGIAGGLLLLRVSEKWVLIAFALTAMFLCGRELTRIYYDSLPTPPGEPREINPS